MANHKSAIKRHRQSIKRRDSNRVARAAVRTESKKIRALVQEGKVDEARAEMKSAESRLAKAASKGLVHPRNAARRASRLAKLVKASK